ncbi:MAG: hypothetical protein WBA57_25305 [Elainellaceae cyanobacterium]
MRENRDSLHKKFSFIVEAIARAWQDDAQPSNPRKLLSQRAEGDRHC